MFANTRRRLNDRRLVALAAIFAAAGCVTMNPAFAQGPASPPPPPEEIQVQTRGPVHEAFAMPAVYDPEPGAVIPNEPPASVNEVPPYDMPEAQQVVWIPGYWDWDADHNYFFWVSGFWRVPPPDCSWVPGYWNEVEGGYQWVPGFWAPGAPEELEYLPQPPASQEDGPESAAPSEDAIWTPGYWAWDGDNYAWRSGFWMQANADWVWASAHYCWTPDGYVFIRGYWDYPLDRRGVLFAPVRFGRPVYEASDYTFTPEIVIDVDVLLDGLFCQPQYNEYFFGDYYSSRWARRGYYPWYEAGDHRMWYDPIYFHERWRHRRDAHWGQNLQAIYQQRHDNKASRPAHTYKDMQAQVGKLPSNERRNYRIVQPLQDIVRSRNPQLKFVQISQQRRQELAHRGAATQDYRRARTQWEAQAPAVSTRASAPLEQRPPRQARPGPTTPAPRQGTPLPQAPVGRVSRPNEAAPAPAPREGAPAEERGARNPSPPPQSAPAPQVVLPGPRDATPRERRPAPEAAPRPQAAPTPPSREQVVAPRHVLPAPPASRAAAPPSGAEAPQPVRGHDEGEAARRVRIPPSPVVGEAIRERKAAPPARPEAPRAEPAHKAAPPPAERAAPPAQKPKDDKDKRK